MPPSNRFSQSCWVALLVLFALQVRWPQLAYPAPGVLLGCGVALVLALAALGQIRAIRVATATPRFNPAAWAGVAFLLYVWLRWAMDGFAAVGSDSFGTLVGCGAYATATYYLLNLSPTKTSATASAPSALYLILCALVIICSVYAALQFFVLYDRTYQQLLAELTNRRPTLTEVALLHHFRLKRVASFWGDPNAYAAFCAASLPAALWCLRTGRGAMLQAVGVIAVVGALAGVALSGSRGGVLDVLFVFLAWTFLLLIQRRSIGTTVGAILLVLISITLFHPSRGTAQPETTASITTAAPPPPAMAAWAWRSTTIRERLYYWHVGRQMLAQSPATGMGLGSVDLYFGRLKPPEAREARYLHNWAVQIAAELGSIGLLLVVGFLGLLAFGVFRNDSWRLSEVLPAALGATVLILDALVQLSFNQRELMALFGLFCGVLLHAGSVPAQSSAMARVRIVGAATILGLAFLVHVAPQLSATHRRQLAEDLLEAGELAHARTQARKAQSFAPRDPANLLLLASIEEAEGRPTGARLHLEKALTLQPESASIRSNLAQLWLGLGNTQKAQQYLEEALQRYPSHWRYHDQMSQLQQMRGDLDAACAHARLAAKFGDGLPGTDHLKSRVQELGCEP